MRIVIILYIYHPHLFCGRGVPRPYKALRRQGYRGDFTALTKALRSSWKLKVGSIVTSYFQLRTCAIRRITPYLNYLIYAT